MNEKIWNVSEVNSVVRELLENSIMPFWLRGEIGTLSIQRSGHVYLTLKDQNAQVRAVFFGGATVMNRLRLGIGAEVEVYGQLTVYEVRGEYQFNVRSIRPVGFGDLQRRFEELKRRLEAEGLFEAERKRSIPVLPEVIGVVTSPDGAAIRDFLQIVQRRFSGLPVRIYPAPVQGTEAAGRLVKGIEFFNRTGEVDVIVLTRGGGSMEDLWPFNEEPLVRAVAASKIPVISAVGHEIDFTLCDFAADLRVPTPSAAAELVAANREELVQQLKRTEKDLFAIINDQRRELQHRLEMSAGSFVFREPIHMVRQKQQQIDEIESKLRETLRTAVYESGRRYLTLDTRFKVLSPQNMLREKLVTVNQYGERLVSYAQRSSAALSARLERAQCGLSNLDPSRVLQRGYAIVSVREDGRIITGPAGLKSDEIIDISLANGKIGARRID
ncbi:MAG: exodeoxyribonuclease VII large subunit [Victivallaceae bacterium]|nr:exodeoxyribonuclease VII large subunit [Victivallaceae bacterium]NLK83012.1 exodeoxyribonuclease VII large subunit [Lentisphaerota bacterium]MDD3116260.1 exodeoxyribonuclease VII large subunit [Victivallaceae bacterium]MDD3702946.1 exodeoxyribonuclease VII large subunit [Victivallaceae bacterium]MDD4317738.1 exodeoxyribonuclease VII large subunit [Victivallaceae bacterium]